MSFPVSDGSIKFVSSLEYRHYISKIGEGKSHRLVANELRKEDGHKARFSPIEIKADFWIAKTALDLSTLKFLLRRFWSKDQNKLCTEHLSVTPSDSRIRKMSDSRIFLWASPEHTKWPSNDFFLIWAECDFSKNLCQFASFLNQLRLA